MTDNSNKPSVMGGVCTAVLVALAMIATMQATELGRMTGGGSVILTADDFVAGTGGDAEGIRVTHGFELYCSDALRPNNLEINIHMPEGGRGQFHLETLEEANCQGDPNFDPSPPPAPFYSFEGAGTGRFNGVAGYCAAWRFTDRGEPGTEDEIYWLHIWDCTENTGTVLMIVPTGHTLTYGTHQAHRLTGRQVTQTTSTVIR